MSLHADKVVASAETYIGMVEFGVGLIPGGGGSKEFAVRASDAYVEGTIDELVMKDFYMSIAMAKVSTSAWEAFDLKILKPGHDEVVLNPSRVISEAKRAVIEMSVDGYTKPVQRKDVKVLGKNGLAMFYAGANSMQSGNFISNTTRRSHENLHMFCVAEICLLTVMFLNNTSSIWNGKHFYHCAEKRKHSREYKVY